MVVGLAAMGWLAEQPSALTTGPVPVPTATPTTTSTASTSAKPQASAPTTPRATPRALTEWQGMLQDDGGWPCERTASCGLARACVDALCVACREDAECLGSEVCVLGHCLLAELAGCRSRIDCEAEQLCVMSGYSADARANGDLRSACLETRGAASNPFSPPRPPEDENRGPLAPVPNQDLLERLREGMQRVDGGDP